MAPRSMHCIWARASEDLSAIEVIVLLLLLFKTGKIIVKVQPWHEIIVRAKQLTLIMWWSPPEINEMQVGQYPLHSGYSVARQ